MGRPHENHCFSDLKGRKNTKESIVDTPENACYDKFGRALDTLREMSWIRK